MANWFDQYFGFAPKANEQDGVWSFGIPQGQAPDVPLWPSPQMPPQSDDPFERAAQRTRQSVQPQGGRTEGMATTLPEDFLIPKTPLDYAMYATMGPFRLPAKALMLGVGAAMNPETAEAGPLSKVTRGVAKALSAKGPKYDPTPANVTRDGDWITFPPKDGRPGYSKMDLQTRVNAQDAPFPQYAEKYPPAGPPQLTDRTTMEPISVKGKREQQGLIDDGTAYWAKVLTPEAEAFQKERAAIIKDMATNGYKPYFDPAQRAHVDPANYPTPHEMSRDALPKKQATIDKYEALLDTPGGRARLQEGYSAGKTVEGSDNWYAVKQLEDKYIKELGAKKGRAEFKTGFADSMAGTTGGSDPTANFLMSQYAGYLNHHGTPTPPSHQFPFPIGGRYAGQNMAVQDKMMLQPESGFGPANPKRHDFSYSFLGHPNKFTFDEQMTGALLPKAQIPPGDSYGIASRIGQEEAAKVGVDPQNFQDVAWAGLKKLKADAAGKTFDYDGPMIGHINAAIERTHRLTGMPREEIVRRGLVRKEIPMYGVLGALGLGAASGGDQQ